MGRRGPSPRPWIRKSSGLYYATINGAQVSLNTRNRREADAEFHRLMAAQGPGNPCGSRVAVRDLVDAYIDDCKGRLDAGTVRSYRRHAMSFAGSYGGMAAADVKILHVQNWLKARVSEAARKDGKKDGSTLATSTRHLAVSVVKMVFEWGEYAGYIAVNPIRRMKRPETERRDPITVADAEAVMAHIVTPVLVALEALFVLGVRAGELCSMAAEKIDLPARKAVVKCKKTGKNRKGRRTVYLSDVAVEILSPLIAARPRGPIFFSTSSPLTPDTLRKAIARARRRACRELGLPTGSLDHVRAHCFRGLYATEALRRRVEAVLVATSLGHVDTRVLMTNYVSPDDPMMIDAVNRGAQMPPSRRDTRPETPG